MSAYSVARLGPLPADGPEEHQWHEDERQEDDVSARRDVDEHRILRVERGDDVRIVAAPALGPAGDPALDHRRLRRARSIWRSASRFAMSRRLSCNSLPRASAISTFARPSFQ